MRRKRSQTLLMTREIPKSHESVLICEVLDAFEIKGKAPLNIIGKYIDATLGYGGHALALAQNGMSVLGIEVDSESLIYAQKRFQSQDLDFKLLVQGNFTEIKEISEKYNFSNVDGILFDLGVNNLQLMSKTRGFSFLYPESELDMRLDPKTQKLKGSDLLNILRKDQLQELFRKTCNRFESQRLSQIICDFRKGKPIKKVGDFLTICQKVFLKKGKIHSATKAFLALRIAVNSELENLNEVLPKAFLLLKPKGRLVVISFHSGEDRIVKEFYKNMEVKKKGVIVNKDPIIPSLEEIERNNKARSAKLRILEKI